MATRTISAASEALNVDALGLQDEPRGGADVCELLMVFDAGSRSRIRQRRQALGVVERGSSSAGRASQNMQMQ